MSQEFRTCNNLGDLPVDERLNYVFGQVLGVQDFRQEQVYFIYKNRLHNRSLHGYGTVWGLGVTTQDTGEALGVYVDPGLAVDACGQEVTVPSVQCARLNGWLSAEVTNAAGETVTRASTLSPLPEDDGRVGVYVILCYAECPTGQQPVFGDPCRADSEAIQPTRIKDDYRLSLEAAPPEQVEEDMVAAVGELLGHIKLGAETLVLTADELAALGQSLRDAIDALPTQPAADFELPPAEARELLREMFRHWAVTKRPALQPADDACILLARVEFALTAGEQVDEAQGIVVNEARRPYLLHTRLLQEWLLAGGGKGEKGDPGADGVSVQSADAESVAPTDPADADFDPATGNIHFKIPRGEPGADGVSVRSADAETVAPTDPADADFDPATGNIHFKIPQGRRGNPGASGGDGGVRRAFINPNMMMPLRGRIPKLQIFGTARPAWVFDSTGLNEVALVFNWGWPETLKHGQPVFLRLYVAADVEGKSTWRVESRWITSTLTAGGPRPPITVLDALATAAPPVVQVDHVPPDGNLPQLGASEFTQLPADEADDVTGELLTVQITLQDLSPNSKQVGLVLVELRWGEGAP